jgi:hypothetical protein
MSYPSAKRNLHQAPIGDKPWPVRFLPALTEDSDKQSNLRLYEASSAFGRDLRTAVGGSASVTVGVE